MSVFAAFRLLLIGIAIVGTAYVCIGSGVFSNKHEDWWGNLPPNKKNILYAAIGATILQSFL